MASEDVYNQWRENKENIKTEEKKVKEKAGGLLGFLVDSYKGLISVIAWLLLIFGCIIGAYEHGFLGAIIGAIVIFISEALIIPPLIILFSIHSELQDIKAILKNK
ncbi:MAG: hypothetical protein IKZ57_07415 [Spirochaetia bacterium]|nr:hypothetical protein [Spirochaetia bacterium]